MATANISSHPSSIILEICSIIFNYILYNVLENLLLLTSILATYSFKYRLLKSKFIVIGVVLLKELVLFKKCCFSVLYTEKILC